jgi:PAS domain S-box-containing protein
VRELLRHRRQLQEEIAERRQAEEALRESEKRYRIVADNTHDWEFWLSPKGQFLYSSPSCRQLTRYTVDEFVNEPGLLYRIIHPEDRERFMLHHQQVVEKKTPGEVEFRILLEDKNVRYIHHVCQPVFDEQGHYLGKRGSNRDITDRKRAEDELARHQDHLEELVQERTAQLEASNKELHAFTYTVSHDLRAPLRHIDGFLALLQKKVGSALDEQGRHYMGAICGAAQKMGLLVDDLLSFSRIGRHALSFQPVELEPLVWEVVGKLEHDAVGREIDWSIGGLPTIRGDAPMLRIVLANLIANALKFTRPRKTARIEIGSKPASNAETVIFVSDNGVGFDMAYADKLFGVFQRLHGADEFEGTGIGLANVHRIIDRHGGRTWAEGKVDQGAVFYFSLPQTSGCPPGCN